MCLIVFAYKTHPDFELILVANRDEFYARPTRPAQFWPDHPNVFAGRDLESSNSDKQGTWIGINKDGRLAAVTNYREMDINESASQRSRGELTAHFLQADMPVEKYLNTVEKNATSYKGFNLLLWENNHFFYISNRIEKIQTLKPGIYGLSNGALDSPWPKVIHAKQELQSTIAQVFSAESLLAVLTNKIQADDSQLPNTGIDIESERLLSPCFIHSEHYGTRASTVVLISKKQEITFLEQNWNAKGVAEEQRLFIQKLNYKNTETKI